MIPIVGYNKKIRFTKFIGYRRCMECGNFADFYLAKKMHSLSLDHIPFLQITENRYIMCVSCEEGQYISRRQYKQLKKKYKYFFDRNECSRHYDYIKQLCKGLKYDEFNLITVYQQFIEKYPINKFEKDYMNMIKDILMYEYNYVK